MCGYMTPVERDLALVQSGPQEILLFYQEPRSSESLLRVLPAMLGTLPCPPNQPATSLPLQRSVLQEVSWCQETPSLSWRHQIYKNRIPSDTNNTDFDLDITNQFCRDIILWCLEENELLGWLGSKNQETEEIAGVLTQGSRRTWEAVVGTGHAWSLDSIGRFRISGFSPSQGHQKSQLVPFGKMLLFSK